MGEDVPMALPRAGTASTRPRVVAAACLVVGLVGALGLTIALPGIFRPWTVPPMLALALVALALQRGDRRAPEGHRSVARFWAGAATSAGLVVLSPAFVLHAFLGYPAASQALRGRARVVGIVVVAAICSLAQAGGPLSPVFSPAVWGVFLLINLVIALSMSAEDRHREETLDRVRTANEELRRAEARNRALHEQLLEQARHAGIVDERQRLARELHDTITQDLIAVISLVGLARDADGDVERRGRLDRAEETARGALAEARRAVGALSSPRLDAADLPGAVSRLLEALEQTCGLRGRLRVMGTARAGANDPVALRIVQESLANASRHARAGTVRVDLDYRAEDLAVEVADDGIGFAAEDQRPGRGLIGMQQRAELVGGSVEVHPVRGEGTRVRAVIPGRWSA